MKAKVGDRIGAVLSANAKCVQLLGYGVYSGDEVPPDGLGGMASVLHECGVPNPKLTLDDGQVTWGCECWWGPEERVKESIGDRAVEMVNIAEARRGPNA